jgi:ubiquinone/menaquinone biosynthesis C-methylase UbiE
MSMTEHRRLQVAAFDQIGDRYDEAFPHRAGQVAAGEWLAAQLTPGSRVLDVGCGTGLPTARNLVDAGMHVTGIDISPARSTC